MIGRNQNAIVAPPTQRLVERTDDVPVDLFERFHFHGRVALVRRLVGRLDVDANQIDLVEGGDGIAAFSGIIGVEIAGGARHFDPPPADERRQPAQQIDAGNHGPLPAVELGERRQSRSARRVPKTMRW